jgi:drug/metabolite transporter (DMT)-like permease
MRPAETSPAGRPALPFTRPMHGFDYMLYGVVVFAWSTSWIALKLQLGTIAPEVSLTWRFAIAALITFAVAIARRENLLFSPAHHLRFAGLGVFLFSMNFAQFYHGGAALPSGLLAVIFSLASVFNMLLGALFLRQSVDRRVLIGAACGFIGVALMFWPQIAGTAFDHQAAMGLALCVGGTLTFCIGNILSAATQRRGVSVIGANAWGMAYGAAILAILAAANGDTFAFDPSLRYVGSLLWLAIVSSVIAFLAYLTLLGRIGSGRAGFSTVMFPVFALAISTLFEGYQWTGLALAGLLLVLAGNWIVLGRR